MYITRSFVEIKSTLEYDFNYFTGSHAAKTDLYLCVTMFSSLVFSYRSIYANLTLHS